MKTYHLASESTVGSDTDYTMTVSDSGAITVSSRKSFDQPYKTDTCLTYREENFDKITINGKTMRALVLEKLDAIRRAGEA